MDQLLDKVYQLECKLTPEQMVVAFTKAGREAKSMIEEQMKQAGWTNWISSSVRSFMGYSGSGAGLSGQDNSSDFFN
jgi:hypothetical protein